jgi:DNA-binding SARP family transcriptional activator
VLAILLLNANRVVSIDRLADELYGDAPPATAVTQLQAQISQLRKVLDPDRPAGAPGSLIETREPGYLIRVHPEQLDLHRFERLAEDALRSLDRGDPKAAAIGFRRALALWRGPALADLNDELFAQAAIARLEELRLAAFEHCIEAELALGRHLELVGELKALAAEWPYRERLQGQLMVALYRSGRQGEALAVYRDARRVLVDSLAVEPTPPLQALERAILRQDPALEVVDGTSVAPTEGRRALLVVERAGIDVDVQLQIAHALMESAETELILARLVEDEDELAVASADVAALRRTLGDSTRAAAFVSRDPGEDVVRLARANIVRLVLVAAAIPSLERELLPAELTAVFDHSPVDVGVVVGKKVDLGSGGSVSVPFGGGEHDWAGLELAAWLASTTGMSLRLVGTASDAIGGRRDASRLLADAALAVQRVVGVECEAGLVEPDEVALNEAVRGSAIVVVGISPRWRSEGIGRVRRALVRAARPPVVLVHRGLRPGGLAPRETSTRFTWSIER